MTVWSFRISKKDSQENKFRTNCFHARLHQFKLFSKSSSSLPLSLSKSKATKHALMFSLTLKQTPWGSHSHNAVNQTGETLQTRVRKSSALRVFPTSNSGKRSQELPKGHVCVTEIRQRLISAIRLWVCKSTRLDEAIQDAHGLCEKQAHTNDVSSPRIRTSNCTQSPSHGW